jgi:hypothetical protein
VKDPDESVGQGALAPSALRVVVVTSTLRLRQGGERPEGAGIEQTLVTGEPRKDDPPVPEALVMGEVPA